MSQWLTSGRNRLLEKQKEKQRFGIISQYTTNQSAEARNLSSAAVSTELISTSSQQTRGTKPQQQIPTMNFSNSSVADQIMMQHQLERQQANMIFLQQLQQQDRNQMAHSIPANLNVPEMRTIDADPLGNARFQNQNDISLMLMQKRQGRLYGNGGVAPFVELSEAQNEFRSMVALQDEMKRQVLQRKLEDQALQRKLEDEIRMVNNLNQQQALVIELERQKLAQRNANTAQFLNQFANFDHLATRQELLSRSLVGNVDSHGGYSSGPINRSNDMLGMNGLGPMAPNQALRLNQRNQFNTMSQVINNLGPRISHLDSMDIHSNHGFKSLETSTNKDTLETEQRRISKGKLEKERNAKISPVNRSTPQQLDLTQPCSESLTESSGASLQIQNESSRGADQSALPKIRYFNNGQEVNEQGNGIERKEDNNSKKRKLLQKMPKEMPVHSMKSKSKFQRKLPLRKGIMSKMAKQNTVKTKKSTSSNSNGDEPRKGSEYNYKEKTSQKGKKKGKKVTGPHHDLMVDLFSTGKKEQKKEDDKLSAANALLGFSKLT